jgi:hypothetical protein
MLLALFLVINIGEIDVLAVRWKGGEKILLVVGMVEESEIGRYHPRRFELRITIYFKNPAPIPIFSPISKQNK